MSAVFNNHTVIWRARAVSMMYSSVTRYNVAMRAFIQ